MKTLSAIIVCTALQLLSACDPADVPESIELREGGFTGEEIYLALAYGVGPAVAVLPRTLRPTAHGARYDALATADREVIRRALQEAADTATARGLSDTARVLSDRSRQLDDLELGEHPAAEADFDAVLDLMRAHDPAFFGRFERDIQSGDRILVAAALERARELGHRVWEEIEVIGPGEDGGRLLDLDIYKDTWLYLDKQVAFEHYVVHHYSDVLEPGSVIYQEVVVDEIAVAFGP